VESKFGLRIEDFLLLAVASGTISLVLTRSHLTKSLRHRFIDAPFMLGELINCPFCMAFWTSLLFTVEVDSNGLHFWPVRWLIITGLSGLYMGFMMKLWLFREDELEEMRELIRMARDTMKARWEKEQAPH